MSVLQPNTIYNIVENTISQNAIKYVDALDNSVDKIISIGSTGLSLKRDILTTAVETIITPLDITDVNTGNSITFDRLTYLPIGLAALEAPPNPTTLHIQDTLLVDKLLSDVSNTVAWDSVTITDSSIGDSCSLTNTGLVFNTPSSGNTNSIYNTGGTDLNVTGSNQLNLGSNDNVNINAGVNCIINVPSGGGNGIYLNTQDGIVNMGDYQQNFNRTYYSLDDASKQIITNTPDGLIWSGDVNAIGSNASVQFNVAHRFQSIFAGRMSNVDEVNNTIGNHCEPYSNFFTTDVDMRMYPRTDYENPLTPNGEGWFCYICNVSGGDINLTADDGLQFVSRANGGFTTTPHIGKYETARITLAFHSSVGFFWSILEGS